MILIGQHDSPSLRRLGIALALHGLADPAARPGLAQHAARLEATAAFMRIAQPFIPPS